MIPLRHKSFSATLGQVNMNPQERYELVRSIGEECIQEDELRELFKTKEHPICYDGFEPSGRMHIAQGIMKTLNVNKMTKAGCKVIFLVADWFAMLNQKLDGDLKKIQIVGKYMIEVWRACGMDMENVSFVWSSDEISQNPEYWFKVMDIAITFTLKRITRCSQIMGRREDNLMASQIFYPCMQCADIFHLKADICQLGMDQRKVNVLAREYCTEKKIAKKPVILSHHMLRGLKETTMKMSKSDPSSAIFMDDTEEEINNKIKKAYCPPGDTDENPIFDYLRHLVFPSFGVFLVVEQEKVTTYTSYEQICADYMAGSVDPGALKQNVAMALNRMVAPVRKRFEEDPRCMKLLKKVKSFQ
jgi:tyrosyl-tRNA synthetase